MNHIDGHGSIAQNKLLMFVVVGSGADFAIGIGGEIQMLALVPSDEIVSYTETHFQ